MPSGWASCKESVQPINLTGGSLTYLRLSFILYVAMGWSILFVGKDFIAGLKATNAMSTLYFLLAGGIAYTVGVIFYAFKKVPYFHSVFHLFVLGGSISHFFSVICLIKQNSPHNFYCKSYFNIYL